MPTSANNLYRDAGLDPIISDNLFEEEAHQLINHAPASVQAQVFTISAGLKTTTAAAGAALGGGIAHLPVQMQLLLIAASPILAGTVGTVALRRCRSST